ncbi:hypothetical protein FRB99_003828 [Tulasnella sp. 403]|nr:hypothetical protein FRB99_003828 [Tulasnella sp. 403]
MALQIDAFVLEPSPDYPYFVSAKRYAPRGRMARHHPDNITLILTHALSLHKETWQPVLEFLFASNTSITEAWSIDAPNHGEAAVLNDRLLSDFSVSCTLSLVLHAGPKPNALLVPWDQYGRAVYHFLTAGTDKGARIDFTKRKLWAVGHSMGATSLIWLQSSDLPICFHTLVLVEPILDPPGRDVLVQDWKRVLSFAYQRRDVWSSRMVALEHISGSRAYKAWNPRALQLYVKHAIRDHPAKEIEYGPFDGVTLACSRFQEAASYRGARGFSDAMVPALAELSRTLPVHIIWGELGDTTPHEAKAALTDVSKSRIRFASVAWVPNAGHLAVQMTPDGVAGAISNIISVASMELSKL